MSDKQPDLKAFPCQFLCRGESGLMEAGEQFGMTLRDYFAAAALQGMLANQVSVNSMTKVFDLNVLIENAWYAADRMLAKRDSKPRPGYDTREPS